MNLKFLIPRKEFLPLCNLWHYRMHSFIIWRQNALYLLRWVQTMLQSLNFSWISFSWNRSHSFASLCMLACNCNFVKVVNGEKHGIKIPLKFPTILKLSLLYSDVSLFFWWWALHFTFTLSFNFKHPNLTPGQEIAYWGESERIESNKVHAKCKVADELWHFVSERKNWNRENAHLCLDCIVRIASLRFLLLLVI